jgi:hypothetical protein
LSIIFELDDIAYNEIASLFINTFQTCPIGKYFLNNIIIDFCVTSPSSDICNHFKKHTHDHDPHDGNDTRQWRVRGNRRYRLQKSIEYEENMDNVLALQE